MALKIRLRQQGRKNRSAYRLVLSESRTPRDGKYIENLGWYNPLEAEPEKNVNIHAERVLYWLNQGAVLTEKAAQLVKRGAPGVLETFQKRVQAGKEKERQKRKRERKKETVSVK